MLADADPQVHQFRAIITDRMGLTFDDSRQNELRTILTARAHAHRVSAQEYLHQHAGGPEEIRELAQLLTVPETYFFRNIDQLDACMERAVPACLAARNGAPLRILSAACASGEEPYTLAMMLRSSFPAYAQHASILAVDINPIVLSRARRGRYTAWSLRETKPELKARFFQPDGAEYVLDRSIRDAVRFEQLNLASPEPNQLLDSSFDIVFCRNALMYFSTAQYTRAIDRLAQALVSGGFLFIGHAETLRGVSQDFHLCHTGNAFYYQRKQGPTRRSSFAPAQSRKSSRPEALSGDPAADGTWVSEIARSNVRVQSLQDDRSNALALQVDQGTGNSAVNGELVDLLQTEQYARALSVLQTTPAANDDADHSLLQAVVSAHAGRFDDARELCGVILEHDELNAGAQYVLALCHEHDGDTARAIYHNQLSAYLDPGFAMPRVHMGLLYRRLGDTVSAGRELREARRLLEREDPARLLLFGGGFGRPALLALCDAELSQSTREAR